MPINARWNHDIPVIAISGKFIGSVEGAVLKNLFKEFADSGDIRIILDMSEAEFIDSTGIGAIIHGLKLLRMEGGDIRLAGMSRRIKMLFKMARLIDTVFESFNNEEHAVLSYEKDAVAV